MPAMSISDAIVRDIKRKTRKKYNAEAHEVSYQILFLARCLHFLFLIEDDEYPQHSLDKMYDSQTW